MLARFFGKHSDIAMVLMVLGVVVVLFAPIPAGLLDFLILTNLSFAFLVLLLTFYMARPVEFSTFPSLLLIATLFRLSLNVSAPSSSAKATTGSDPVPLAAPGATASSSRQGSTCSSAGRAARRAMRSTW